MAWPKVDGLKRLILTTSLRQPGKSPEAKQFYCTVLLVDPDSAQI
jgi:hypothetical protein